MRTTDYGPVPVSRIKSESAALFDALASGRRVLVSKHSRVVAAIDPPEAIPVELLVGYALPGDRVLVELSASEINQGSPSAAVTASMQGSPSYVTKDGRVYGLLREISESELAAQLPTQELVAERERRLDEFLERYPGADAEQLAAFSEKLDMQLDIPEGRVAPELTAILGVQDLARLRSHVQLIVQPSAARDGVSAPEPHGAEEASNSSISRSIEPRTSEMAARIVEEAVAAGVKEATAGMNETTARLVEEAVAAGVKEATAGMNETTARLVEEAVAAGVKEATADRTETARLIEEAVSLRKALVLSTKRSRAIDAGKIEYVVREAATVRRKGHAARARAAQRKKSL